MFVTAVIKVEGVIESRPSLCFEFLFSLIIKKIIEPTKNFFPGFSVNDNDDVFILVSFISIAIIFLVIAFSQLTYAKPVACKKASKNKFVLSSARDRQTSNIIFTVGANR